MSAGEPTHGTADPLGAQPDQRAGALVALGRAAAATRRRRRRTGLGPARRRRWRRRSARRRRAGDGAPGVGGDERLVGRARRRRPSAPSSAGGARRPTCTRRRPGRRPSAGCVTTTMHASAPGSGRSSTAPVTTTTWSKPAASTCSSAHSHTGRPSERGEQLVAPWPAEARPGAGGEQGGDAMAPPERTRMGARGRRRAGAEWPVDHRTRRKHDEHDDEKFADVLIVAIR